MILNKIEEVYSEKLFEFMFTPLLKRKFVNSYSFTFTLYISYNAQENVTNSLKKKLEKKPKKVAKNKDFNNPII